MDVHGHFRHHTDPTTGDPHAWCNQNCKMHGVTGTAMLRPANEDDIKRFFKPLYRYLQRSATSRRPNQDRARVYNAFRSTPKWRDWVENIDMLTDHPRSVFSDGHFARNEDEHWDLQQVPVWPPISQPNHPAPPPWNRDLALERATAVPLPALAQGAAGAAQALPAFPGFQLVPLGAYPPGDSPLHVLYPPGYPLPPSSVGSPAPTVPAPAPVFAAPGGGFGAPPEVFGGAAPVFTAPPPVSFPPPSEFPPAPASALSPPRNAIPGPLGREQTPEAEDITRDDDMTPNDDMTPHLRRLSVDEEGAPIFPIVYPVVALNEAGHTAPFTPLPNARMPKRMIVGVWSLYTDEDLWNSEVGRKMDKQKKGLPYFTQMTVDLSNENAVTWERYVRSLPFMSRLVGFGKLRGGKLVDYYIHEWACCFICCSLLKY